VVRSPVGALADEHGIEVLTPAKASDPEFLDRLRALAPDCCPVVAYGALLPQSALDIPVHGWVNLHFSVLPAWRGAAPVQAAVRHGDEITGASAFRIVKALDAGPVFGVLTEAVRPDDTAGVLLDRLAEAGAHLLVSTVAGIGDGTLVAVEQPADGVSYAPKISTEDARLDFTAPAVAVDRLARAVTPDPGAWAEFRGERIKLGPVRRTDADPLAPGELLVERKRVLVGTATEPVALGDVQAQGKKRMAATDWARGARVEPAERLK
jgi:methionyl-tRNA formyltransferase